MSEKVLVETLDGSHSIHVQELDEGYHSINGAWSESMHVFINHGFRRVLPCINPIKILEIGFGSGLNAFLTYLEVHQQNRRVHYVGLEPDPLAKTLWASLNYPTLAGIDEAVDVFNQMHEGQWDTPVFIGEAFILHKVKQQLEEVKLADHAFHLIYFDAFSPGTQPELWTAGVMERMYKTLLPGGILVTYAARGELRRSLEAIGFEVERLQGAAGKHEMLRATKPVKKHGC